MCGDEACWTHPLCEERGCPCPLLNISTPSYPEDNRGDQPGNNYPVVLGQDFKLVADIVGNMADIRPVWKKEDGQINGRHFQQGNTLYVKNAQRKDAGVYICQGINSRGNVIFEYRAVVTISGRSPCLLSSVSTVL